jgi:hypothetical protein
MPHRAGLPASVLLCVRRENFKVSVVARRTLYASVVVHGEEPSPKVWAYWYSLVGTILFGHGSVGGLSYLRQEDVSFV